MRQKKLKVKQLMHWKIQKSKSFGVFSSTLHLITKALRRDLRFTKSLQKSFSKCFWCNANKKHS